MSPLILTSLQQQQYLVILKIPAMYNVTEQIMLTLPILHFGWYLHIKHNYTSFLSAKEKFKQLFDSSWNRKEKKLRFITSSPRQSSLQTLSSVRLSVDYL